ncbi:Protein of unknown function [Arboricoccus pini]|uniref:DUF4440 domain-containing protein n=1 Tax=Arboricoccus pini TaxID=1963835 RepID=A0A212RS69_9PROT|nr:oxalurate catabolism protein HpxZ [Arboricoccus pini]SNB75416.1 Protein of unknown function [Arboricoccus pini]
MEINRPDVVAEIEALFARYEQALVANDVEVLDHMFWDDPRTLRYGVAEVLHGIQAIREYRRAVNWGNATRILEGTRITTFGRDMAVVNTEFRRGGAELHGRQSQTWVRLPEGWRIVSAHVSHQVAAR